MIVISSHCDIFCRPGISYRYSPFRTPHHLRYIPPYTMLNSVLDVPARVVPEGRRGEHGRKRQQGEASVWTTRYFS
jgi:hypothetical protein